MRRRKRKPTMRQSVFADPKYKGKHLIVVGSKVFAAATGGEAAKLFDRVMKRYPCRKPTLAYIPKEGTLILWF